VVNSLVGLTSAVVDLVLGAAHEDLVLPRRLNSLLFPSSLVLR